MRHRADVMAYEYQEFPKYLYHPKLAPAGRLFQSAEETKGLESEGWVDTPAKFPRPSRRDLSELRQDFESAEEQYRFWTSGGACEPYSITWEEATAKYQAARDRYEFALREAEVSATDLSKLADRTTRPIASGAGGFTAEDRGFARLAIDEARKSVSEDDGRTHPKVGVIVVKDGRVVASAHRGETLGCHAEYVALEKKLADEPLAGATVCTTLEPCTTRNHPKIPCAMRLVERKVARVVIGMLDPNPGIMGRGVQALRAANIAIDLFPHDLMCEVEELNRDFRRLHESAESKEAPKPATMSVASPLRGSRSSRLRVGELGSSVRIATAVGCTAQIIAVENVEGGFPNTCANVRATIAFASSHTGEQIKVQGLFTRTDGQSITMEPLSRVSLKMSESTGLVLLVRNALSQRFLTFSQWPFDPSAESVLEFGDWDLEVSVASDSDREGAIANFRVRLEPALSSRWSRVL